MNSHTSETIDLLLKTFDGKFLYTVEDLSKISSLATTTIYTRVSKANRGIKADIPVITKRGSNVYFKIIDVAQWLEDSSENQPKGKRGRLTKSEEIRRRSKIANN